MNIKVNDCVDCPFCHLDQLAEPYCVCPESKVEDGDIKYGSVAEMCPLKDGDVVLTLA